MLFKKRILDGIADGTITVAFRRWKRPTVKAGGTLKTPIGLLAIKSVDVIDENDVTKAAAKKAGFDSKDDLRASLGDRDGQLYRIKLQHSGDDPRIALRGDDDLDVSPSLLAFFAETSTIL